MINSSTPHNSYNQNYKQNFGYQPQPQNDSSDEESLHIVIEINDSDSINEDDNNFNINNDNSNSNTGSEFPSLLLQNSNDINYGDVVIKKVKTETGFLPIMQSERPQEALQIEMIDPSEQAPLLDITELSLQELIEDVIVIQENSSPQERFTTLCNAFTPVPAIPGKDSYRSLWLSVPNPSQPDDDAYMSITIEELPYDSQCLEEEDQYPGKKSPTNQTYYFIKSCEQDDAEQFCFQIRLNKEFTNAEILHIQANTEISGTKVKEICMRLINFIQPDMTLLFDDSKIPNENPNFVKYMRLYMPIVNVIPKTWYSENNFRILELDQDLQFEGHQRSHQSLEVYNEAVKTIRSTKASTLIKVDDILKQFRTYLSANQKMIVHDVTVHDIGKAVFQKLKQANHCGKASKDFTCFYNTFLISGSIPNSPEAYNNALNVLFASKIWILKK